MDIELIRQLLEDLLCQLARENYMYGTGQKTSYAGAEIYRRHSQLFSPFTLPRIRDHLVFAEGEEKRRYSILYGAILSMLVNDRVKDVTEKVIAYRDKCKIHLGGQEYPFRQAENMALNISQREQRLLIEEQQAKVAANLSGLYRDYWTITSTLVKKLGFLSYTEFTEQVINLDLHRFSSELEKFLRDTQELYLGALEPYLERELGKKSSEATRTDLAYLFRGHAFDQWFKAERLMEVIRDSLGKMGLELEHPHIALDIEARSAKIPGTCSTAVQVPQEVYLIITPQGGHEDYEGILHECGHALHYAHTSPQLPLEYKRLGDIAVSEAYGFLLQYLTAHEGWLSRYVTMPSYDEYMHFTWLKKLFLVRRQAARVLYETWLHAQGSYSPEARDVYASLMRRATGVNYRPEFYLTEVSQRFYSVHFLRGWILETQLRKYLENKLGQNWPLTTATGTLLKEFFTHGGKYYVDELSRQLGYHRLNTDALKREFFSRLG